MSILKWPVSQNFSALTTKPNIEKRHGVAFLSHYQILNAVRHPSFWREHMVGKRLGGRSCFCPLLILCEKDCNVYSFAGQLKNRLQRHLFGASIKERRWVIARIIRLFQNYWHYTRYLHLRFCQTTYSLQIYLFRLLKLMTHNSLYWAIALYSLSLMIDL